MTMVNIPDKLYLRSIGRPISTVNMGGDMVTYAIVNALDARFRKCKTKGAQMRLFESLEQGDWSAKKATFQDKINDMEAYDLVAMLSPAQRQALINVLKGLIP